MKALLLYPSFPQTFWSFNRVNGMLGKKALQAPLGMLTLASLLPKEWDLRLINRQYQQVSSRDWDEAELVLVSGMLVQHGRILELIREAKKRGKTVAVGGPWAFHMPDEALRAGADLVVRGEGEVAVPLFLEKLHRKEFGEVISAEGRADLRNAPLPRYDLVRLNDYNDMAIEFSRGCPFQCEFCDITHMFGRRVRTKAPEQVLNELEQLFALGWRRSVFFVDDNLIGDPGKTKALLRQMIPWMEMRGHPFEFYTQVSVNLAEDDELLDLMVRAGFYKVFVGIETVDEESLKLAKKHQNTGLDLGLACRKINRAGLEVIAGCIIGFDTESAGSDRRLIDFARKNHIPEMFINMLQAGSGTALWSRLEKEGRLLPVNHEHYSNNTGLMNFVPSRPMGEIAGELINLYEVLYDPAFYLDRAFNHILEMAPPPERKPFKPPYLCELRAVLIVLARQGIIYPSRRKFWKYLFRTLTEFPWYLNRFLTYCVIAEHYFEYRQTIKSTLTIQLQALRSDANLSEGKSIPGT
jgi:radical SAM superfamily enzyme YgiQ (UPF0313 family)